MGNINNAALKLLQSAGWYKGRDIGNGQISKWSDRSHITMFEAAEKALREFGGLEIEQSGPGVSCSRSSFRFDPSDGIDEHDKITAHADIHGIRLFPVGEIEDHFILVAENGEVCLLRDEVVWIAQSIYRAIEVLVDGRQRCHYSRL